LSSVYDVDGQQISPSSFKALQCPLFIDSSAEPSASASRAILMAEARVRAEEPKEQTAAPAQNTPIVVMAAAGVVAQFPQPEMQESKTQQTPQAASKAQARKTQSRRVATAVSDLGLQNQQLRPETSKPGQELTLQILAGSSPQQVEGTRERQSSLSQSQKSLILSFAETTGLLRQTRTGNSEALLEFNPMIVLLDFVAFFAAVLAFCLLVYHSGLHTAAVPNRADLYRALMDGMDLRAQQPVRRTHRRAPTMQASASALMFPVAR
jgi:hypothetical protein